MHAASQVTEEELTSSQTIPLVSFLLSLHPYFSFLAFVAASGTAVNRNELVRGSTNGGGRGQIKVAASVQKPSWMSSFWNCGDVAVVPCIGQTSFVRHALKFCGIVALLVVNVWNRNVIRFGMLYWSHRVCVDIISFICVWIFKML